MLVQEIAMLAAQIGADFKALATGQGDLSTLQTTEKGSLVGAINELHRAGGTGQGAVIGEVRQFAGSASALTAGWRVCDGAALSRVDHAGLFAVIGTRFGAGDGASTFNLPNLVGKFPAGAAPAAGPGGIGGSNEISLAVEHMPEHGHSLGANAKLLVVPGSTGVDPSASVDPYYLTGVTTAATGPMTITAPDGTASALRGFGGATEVSGAGQPFDNRPAFVELLYIIYGG